MRDTLISFETAKLANEKGFDEGCLYRYPIQDFCNWDCDYNTSYRTGKAFKKIWGFDDEEQEKYIIDAPTQSLLQKWLRENYFIEIKIEPLGWDTDKHWAYRGAVYKFEKISDFYYAQEKSIGLVSDNKNDGFIFRSYEEVLEKGLIVGLSLI